MTDLVLTSQKIRMCKLQLPLCSMNKHIPASSSFLLATELSIKGEAFLFQSGSGGRKVLKWKTFVLQQKQTC